MTETSLEQLVDAHFDFRLASINTALVCEIVNVRTQSKQIWVDVQPIVNRIYKDGEIQEYPQLLSVPVLFPRSSAGGITFPLVKGDDVVVIFSKHGLDVFKQGSTSTHDPIDTRQFSLRDGVAIPCIFPFSKSPDLGRALPYSQDDVIVANNIGKPTECEIRLKPDGSVNVTATTVSVTAQTALVQAPTTTIVGNIVLDGNVAVTGSLSVAGSATFAGANTFVGISTFNGALVSTTTTTLTGAATYNGQTIATV